MGNGNPVDNLTNSKKRKSGCGRTKGAKNKITANIKEAIEDAFEEVGGKDWLVSLAKSDPKTFANLLAKIMPIVREVVSDGEDIMQPVKISVNLVSNDPTKKFEESNKSDNIDLSPLLKNISNQK